MVRVLVEAVGHKFFERPGEISVQLWWLVLGDEEERSHGVQVSIGGLPLCQLNGCNPQRPDVGLREKTTMRGRETIAAMSALGS